MSIEHQKKEALTNIRAPWNLKKPGRLELELEKGLILILYEQNKF